MMQKLVASMIHHAADLFKVCTFTLLSPNMIQSFVAAVPQDLKKCFPSDQ